MTDKRILQLLAVIAKKDEALERIVGWSSKPVRQAIAKEALAIKPDDVELVEVGEYEIADGMFIFYPDQSKCAPVEYENSKLYTIKTKE